MGGIARVFQETLQFFASLIKPAARSLSENRGLAALSIVLAFGLWIFVTDSENPTRTTVLGDLDIPVEPVNVPDDIAIAEAINPIHVRVTVAEDEIEHLLVSDFEATVDLDGLTVGSYDLPVDVTASHSRGGLRVVESLPNEVTVELTQLASKSVPVELEVIGDPPPGYTMEPPVLDDDTVFVTGPQEEVDKVAQATATINVSSRTTPVDQSVSLTPRDNRGFLVQRVSLQPSAMGVRIEIEQQRFTRSVAVSVFTEGTPATGYNVSFVSVSPPTITIQGSETLIAGTTSIKTQPIDIDDRDESVVRTVSLDLPAGVEVTGGVPVVEVTITITPAGSEFNFTVPVTARNLESDVSIVGALPQVTVTLIGPSPTLSELSPADINATVDLNDLGAGTHTVEVSVAPLANVAVADIEPGDIEVVLEQQ